MSTPGLLTLAGHLIAGLVADGAPSPLPSFLARDCPFGQITEIEVRTNPVFDPGSTDNALLRTAYQLANLPRIRTREEFVRSELLVEEGECFDPHRVAESARHLERHRFLAHSVIRPEDDGEGGVRLVVETRDEWSLQFDVAAGYDDGFRLERLRLADQNFAGRGIGAELRWIGDRYRRDTFARIRIPGGEASMGGDLLVGRGQRGPLFEQTLRGHLRINGTRTGFAQWSSWLPDAFVYSGGGRLPSSNFVHHHRRESAEILLGRQLARPGPPLVVNVTAGWRRWGFDDPFEIIERNRVSRPAAARAEAFAQELGRQATSEAAFRGLVHVTRRNYRFREFTGLDAIREVQTIPVGSRMGASLGASFGRFGPPGTPLTFVPQARVLADQLWELGPVLVRAAGSAEGRWNDGIRDVLAEASLAAYARSPLLPGQTLFFRGSAAGGWETHIPFQLWLGGTGGVRSLPEYALPGGKIMHFTAENRMAFPVPDWAPGDVGITLFTDAGRVWAGDAPFGKDSNWRVGMGAGLRLAVPKKSRTVYRLDVAVPVGAGLRTPIYRVTFETSRMNQGFVHRRILRSFRTHHY